MPEVVVVVGGGCGVAGMIPVCFNSKRFAVNGSVRVARVPVRRG